jgi:hypothetical protein
MTIGTKGMLLSMEHRAGIATYAPHSIHGYDLTRTRSVRPHLKQHRRAHALSLKQEFSTWSLVSYENKVKI